MNMCHLNLTCTELKEHTFVSQAGTDEYWPPVHKQVSLVHKAELKAYTFLLQASTITTGRRYVNMLLLYITAH
jgi:hypothetical protein